MFTQLADILVVAVGKEKLITPDHIKKDSVLIDVGINFVSDASKKSGYRIVGDVDPLCYEKCSRYTPVPGGVGVLTVSMLLQNTINAAKKRAGLDF